MPELPEVETIRRQLAAALEGRRLQAVDVRDPRWSMPAPP
jgi:formamidopyrimidine-DNA glycosylase